jgi:hypothetical protein
MTQCFNKKGYAYVRIINANGNYTFKTIHKLVAEAFLNHKPDGTHKIVVDHINNNRTDNRAENLQLISQRENASKDVKNKTSKFTGVHITKKGEIKAQIFCNGKNLSLGNFKTEEEASEYYQNAVKAIYNGEDIVFKKPIYTSKYKGIHFCNVKKRWVLILKSKYVSCFKTEQEAFEARENYINKLNINK